ncbi:P-loop containing nucleoside triphosphate hydrolase protein [Perkinsela sp. CCAP 1560/4]|nr:P-loop containing nucleoside triphosphate hydrolase protein [Perkinsela sp. CCAP 1560/4]|eukprot:KNH04894.1 P-loop containing nucleoside triphosphate hydrolase protein [Perkinsela sp. CCAP 1560/4]
MSYDADSMELLHRRLSKIQKILVVLSGKGGVGKSTVATQVATYLAHSDATGLRRVGIIDVDLCGPDIPNLLSTRGGEVSSAMISLPDGSEEEVWMPSRANGGSEHGQIYFVSMALLLGSESDAVIWRGARKDAMINELFRKVAWDRVDDGVEYLIVDSPPGTSDEHLTLFQLLSSYKQWRAEVDPKNRFTVGCVIVTTPQLVATDDVAKMISFCKTIGTDGCPEIVGLIENMSGMYMCPHCQHGWPIFSNAGTEHTPQSPAEALAKRRDIPFLGSIPMNIKWSRPNYSQVGSIPFSPDGPVTAIVNKIELFFDTKGE